MKKYILILLIFNFIASNSKAQPIEKQVELVLGKSVHVESKGQSFSINTSVTRWKSKVVVRIASAGEIRDSSLVLHVVLPVVNGYDYDLADLISQNKDASLEGKAVIPFPAIRRTDGTYAFAVPLIQTLSNYPQRKEIYIGFKQ
ncbi:hypothetical protein [Dyadobacter luteus]|nr:hypothetical protein [Dyadobacter luteus]